jgi:hypothetical protein
VSLESVLKMIFLNTFRKKEVKRRTRMTNKIVFGVKEALPMLN